MLGVEEHEMKLHTVTISGPDDGTAPDELMTISKEYPFVEWGILLSSRREPKPRYPTPRWICSIEPLLQQGISLSGHVCGGWARKICKGRFAEELNRPMFERMQLNVAHFFQKEVKDVGAMAACLPKNREYIVQVGPALQEGLSLVKGLQGYGLTISVLFDASGGHGVTPEQLPTLVAGVKCAFAGGLGPDNLSEEL